MEVEDCGYGCVVGGGRGGDALDPGAELEGPVPAPRPGQRAHHLPPHPRHLAALAHGGGGEGARRHPCGEGEEGGGGG